jgi:hypothetical protein
MTMRKSEVKQLRSGDHVRIRHHVHLATVQRVVHHDPEYPTAKFPLVEMSDGRLVTYLLLMKPRPEELRTIRTNAVLAKLQDDKEEWPMLFGLLYTQMAVGYVDQKAERELGRIIDFVAIARRLDELRKAMFGDNERVD